MTSLPPIRGFLCKVEDTNELQNSRWHVHCSNRPKDPHKVRGSRVKFFSLPQVLERRQAPGTGEGVGTVFAQLQLSVDRPSFLGSDSSAGPADLSAERERERWSCGTARQARPAVLACDTSCTTKQTSSQSGARPKAALSSPVLASAAVVDCSIRCHPVREGPAHHHLPLPPCAYRPPRPQRQHTPPRSLAR